ncbi:upf0577 protein KIAA1324-like [Clonorchis sinensis]|uniref:Upf0577 protein KIAA1324-like n=1 Tax=Clonorchis sinensis TaxID=79923 RepID=A0A8T1MRV4_CLOSI|nr:upf0577 protein KIAA1324-like [Clonorchis sinensis]
MNILISSWILVTLVPLLHVKGESCASSSLHYEASDCNARGDRWVFKVPEDDDNCLLTSESIPRRQHNCDKTCSAGHYLDMDSQECKLCPVGTYSRGNVLELSKWKTVPTELATDVTYSSQPSDGCNLTQWIPMGDHLFGKATPGCSAVLSLQLNNLQDGEVSFLYNIADAATMVFFTIHNEHCTRLPESTFILQRTGQNVLYNVSSPLRKGRYVLQWELFVDQNTFGYLFGHRVASIRIFEIRIRGTPPILHCNACPAGTYANAGGMSQCESCPANTFSSAGAQTCTACAVDEYSSPGSDKCNRRLPCTEKDFMEVWTPCDQQGKTWKTYKWIEPVICNIQTGVQLPQSGNPVDCTCPIGTRFYNATACESCPADQSVTDSTCLRCESDKVPVFGLHYDRWSRFPPHLTTWCLSMFKNGCSEWTLNMDHISAGIGLHLSTASFLHLSIPFGFVRSDDLDTGNAGEVVRNPPLPNTYLRVEFELVCTSCELILRQQRGNVNTPLIQWLGKAERQNYTLTIEDSAAVNFTWEFRKKAPNPEVSQSDLLLEHVKIYQLEVTNAKLLGTIGCRKCLKGIQDGKCISCPPGLFYASTLNGSTRQEVVNCTQCPENTILQTDAHATRTVSEACIPCEPGTKAVNRSVCVVDTMPVVDNGMLYNLTELLLKNRTVYGANLFTPTGTKYHYEYHLSFMYGHPVRCVEEYDAVMVNYMEALICRQTIVHVPSAPDKNQRVLPLRLGDRLERAVQSNHSKKFWDEVNTNLTRAGWTADSVGTDLHYIFVASGSSENCPSGVRTVVTFRCGLGQSLESLNSSMFTDQGQLELPPSCPDATCDGCTYHFLWRSSHACPICSERQITRFSGECRYGSRRVYAISREPCRIPTELLAVQEIPCPLLTTAQIVAIFLTGFTLITLVTIIFSCYRKNKRLEYKYMKLVQSKGGMGQPTSCALDENEEDNLDHFGRRAVRSNNVTNAAFELEATGSVKAPTSAPLALKMPWPILGPILFKKGDQQDLHPLPENEMRGGVA